VPARALWRDPEAHATSLLVWAVDRFGWDEETRQPNVVAWHPTTVRLEIERVLGFDPPRLSFDKLMAAVAVLSTDLFFRRAGAFAALSNVLAGDDFQPDEYDQPSAAEMAWAITEALLLSPPAHDDPEPFSDEVRHYIGQVLREEGFLQPPDVLRVALGSPSQPTEYPDDPELSARIKDNQRQKREEVTQAIVDGLMELLRQIQSLRLEDGRTEELEKHITEALKGKGGGL